MTLPFSENQSFDQLPKYRAPDQDREALVSPSLLGLIDRAAAKSHRSQHAFDATRAAKLFPVTSSAQVNDGRNDSLLGSADSTLRLGSRSLEQVRHTARLDTIRAAIRHTESYRDLWFDKEAYIAQSGAQPWLVAGHQPELFHPGVWFKNFLLSRAGSQTGAVPLNLIIDNDLCRAPSIRVLTQGGLGSDPLRTESVMFDAPSAAVAWECRPLVDRGLFDSFPSRVRASLMDHVRHPLVDRLWIHARNASRQTGRLGLIIAQARHALEGELGLQTLELPLSQLCEQSSFACFSLELLRQLPRFHQIYNSKRAEYRTANGIRSESHPVQALTEKHAWLEAPWWVYRSDTPARKRLFAKLSGGNLLLSDQSGWQATIEGPLDEDDAVAQWQEFAVDGVLLRPRALITTMFVRMVVSDLFMHGIGGGKYDQLTDAIIREFFSVDAPPMCVATATLKLPLAAEVVGGSLVENRTASQHEIDTLRRLRYHPEEHVAAPDSETQQLLEAKHEMLRAIPPRGEKWQWHRQITRINQRLADLNRGAMQESEQRLQSLSAHQRQLKLATSRELSFCLFELPYIADTLQGLAEQQFDRPSAK